MRIPISIVVKGVSLDLIVQTTDVQTHSALTEQADRVHVKCLQTAQTLAAFLEAVAKGQ